MNQREREAMQAVLDALEFVKRPEGGLPDFAAVVANLRTILAEPDEQVKPLTDEQIDRAISELGLNYLANVANNRAVLRELCRRAAHGIKEQK